MRHVKVGVALVLAIAVLLFILQNTQIVQLNFVVWTLSISRAVVVLSTLVIGMVLGWMWCSEMSDRKKARR